MRYEKEGTRLGGPLVLQENDIKIVHCLAHQDHNKLEIGSLGIGAGLLALGEARAVGLRLVLEIAVLHFR